MYNNNFNNYDNYEEYNEPYMEQYENKDFINRIKNNPEKFIRSWTKIVLIGVFSIFALAGVIMLIMFYLITHA